MAPPVPSRRAAMALAFVITLGAGGAARAQGDSYKLHMDNGVKLYADRNYPAAVVEFQAAYEARANANPLVNIALCDKEMFRYPQAIAALEAALGKHGDAMDPADRKAAEDAIREMRALLGTVVISVSPPVAQLFVDGEEIAPEMVAKPIPLGPGAHRIAARADGYAPTEQSVTVASRREQAVAITLVAEKGLVTIEAPDPRTTIALDERPVGNGRWSGMLEPGRHVVQMYGADGQPYTTQILVAAGVPLHVRKGEGGTPVPPPKKSEEPPHRGFYVLGLGSMLFAITHPPDFTHPPELPGPKLPDYGAGYGVRAGFQVNKNAGFDLTYEHSSIFTYATASDQVYYRIVANRIAAGLRLISETQRVRFVGTFGGGVVADEMSVNLPMCAPRDSGTPCYLNGSHSGWDAFALVEAGIEVDVDHVLLDFSAEGQLQSTGNLTGAANKAIFGSHALINGGPAIRIGYRFW